MDDFVLRTLFDRDKACEGMCIPGNCPGPAKRQGCTVNPGGRVGKVRNVSSENALSRLAAACG